MTQFNACSAYVKPIGGTYQQNWEKKLKEATDLLAKATKENNSIYYEIVPKEDQVDKPNPKNYVKLVDCSADFNATPEIDN